ncbi:PREDICTED: RING-H2 finger protein ATL10-like [Camelina sativa]|uniref:RING-type E3 ubiquitin transferase n=1 Tax=Camelina sativa TaxID=90675 RepID=A0ABM0VIV1_CAMSA|nr:PREDICTED: RING-H2 finger protein ATL10-like [Camelina sativa]
MNGPIPEPVVDIQVQVRRLSPSEEYTNSGRFIINTINKEIRVNLTTGHETQTLEPYSYHSTNFSLPSFSHYDIQSSLQNLLHSEDHWLCDRLVPKISTTAINSGFGDNDIELTVLVTVTYQRESVQSLNVLMRIVLQGRIEADELKSLNMETESCSICLKSLVSSSEILTRMGCSHVFHGYCLLKWLKRKNTCPLCRTVLYDDQLL